MINKKFKELFF